MAAFRARFGKSYDADLGGDGRAEKKKSVQKEDGKQSKEEEEAAAAAAEQEEDDNLLDLISSFGQEEGAPTGTWVAAKNDKNKNKKGKK